MGRTLIVCCSIILSVGIKADVDTPSTLGVLSQAEHLPAGFEEHFFDVPLAVRIDVNATMLGDALVILGRDETVRLLSFTDTGGQPIARGRSRRVAGAVVHGHCAGQLYAKLC